jgi:hypothetical protein
MELPKTDVPKEFNDCLCPDCLKLYVDTKKISGPDYTDPE